VSRFLRSGHHEAVLPARLSGAEFSLRVWIEMQDIVPLLETLDAMFGEPGRPYCTHVEQLRVAQETLVELMAQVLRAHPEKARRACVETAVAQRSSFSLESGVWRSTRRTRCRSTRWTLTSATSPFISQRCLRPLELRA